MRACDCGYNKRMDGAVWKSFGYLLIMLVLSLLCVALWTNVGLSSDIRLSLLRRVLLICPSFYDVIVGVPCTHVLLASGTSSPLSFHFLILSFVIWGDEQHKSQYMSNSS